MSLSVSLGLQVNAHKRPIAAMEIVGGTLWSGTRFGTIRSWNMTQPAAIQARGPERPSNVVFDALIAVAEQVVQGSDTDDACTPPPSRPGSGAFGSESEQLHPWLASVAMQV